MADAAVWLVPWNDEAISLLNSNPSTLTYPD